MTYETYRYIFLGGAVLAGIMLLTSILLFIFLHIPAIIGDLTGRNAKRAIEQIRNQNESTGNKTYKSSPVNRERGKLTDKISDSGRLLRKSEDLNGGAMLTEKISTDRLKPQYRRGDADETTILDTDMGSGNETTILYSEPVSGNETTILSTEPAGSGETTILGQWDTQNGEMSVLWGLEDVFEIEFEITYIHSDEIIM